MIVGIHFYRWNNKYHSCAIPYQDNFCNSWLFGLSNNDFVSLNPGIDCNNLFPPSIKLGFSSFLKVRVIGWRMNQLSFLMRGFVLNQFYWDCAPQNHVAVPFHLHVPSWTHKQHLVRTSIFSSTQPHLFLIHSSFIFGLSRFVWQLMALSLKVLVAVIAKRLMFKVAQRAPPSWPSTSETLPPSGQSATHGSHVLTRSKVIEKWFVRPLQWQADLCYVCVDWRQILHLPYLDDDARKCNVWWWRTLSPSYSS